MRAHRGDLVASTAGRVLLYEIVPKQLPFKIVNRTMGKKQLGDLIDSCYRACGQKETVLLADKLRSLGYTYATKAGISICVDDLQIPARKVELLETAQKDVQEIEEQYTEGLITDGERYNKVVDIWAQVSEQIAEEMMTEIGTEELVNDETGEKRRTPSFNPIYIMADSGARGSAQQIRQLAGMRGLMAKPSGEIIETPITTNFREGLSVLQYFISTHAPTKGGETPRSRPPTPASPGGSSTAQDCIIASTTAAPWRHRLGARRGRRDHRSSGPHPRRVAVEASSDPYRRGAGRLTRRRRKAASSGTPASTTSRSRSVLTCETRRICACCGRDLAPGRQFDRRGRSASDAASRS